MLQYIKYAKLHPDAKPPVRKNPTDAGIDFYALEDVQIQPHSMKIVHTGITLQIPKNFMLLIKPKGKNNHLIGAGIVDSFYQPGEVLVKVANITEESLHIAKGEAIAQGIYILVETPELLEAPLETLENQSARSGTGGIVNQAKTDKILKELGF